MTTRKYIKKKLYKNKKLAKKNFKLAKQQSKSKRDTNVVHPSYFFKEQAKKR